MAFKNEQKQEILKYWNSKKITLHKKLSPDVSTELTKLGRFYDVEDMKEFIDFYATILEIGVPEHKQKYFWTYKWNLYEFLKRGIKKFDGQEADNYLKNQVINSDEAIIFTRN